jgi:hypothetical protein
MQNSPVDSLTRIGLEQQQRRDDGMMQLVVLALSGLVFVGCGAAASASPSPAPSAAGSASGATGPAHRLFDCHAASEPFACPLSPGLYVAEIHDRFSLKIKDPGWQEGRTNPEDLQDQEPTLLLNRIADPNQRLMIDTGPTGPNVSDTQLLPDVTSLQMGPPAPVRIGSTTGFQVDLAPTNSMELSVPVVPNTGFQLEPGNTYRLIVTQLPMGDESGIKLILISSPTAAWSAFLPLADAVVETLQFE